MAFNFSKISGTKSTQIVSIGDQEVTVTEIPFILLLRVKKIKKVLAAAISRFTQHTPLSKQTKKSESLPLAGADKSQSMTTDTLDLELPSVELIDKAVELKEQAIGELLEALLDDELLYDVLRCTVIEFKDVPKEELLGEDGLTIPMMLSLLKAVVELNAKDLEFLGNFFSLLKSKV